MAPATRILNDLMIEPGDLDRVGISAAREIKGVPESVVRLHRILPDNVMGSVAIVAGRHRVMARFHPGVVLRLHYVAVRAGGGIIRQVGVSLGVEERVSTKAYRDSEDDSGNKTDGKRALHRIVLSGQSKIRLRIVSCKGERRLLSKNAGG